MPNWLAGGVFSPRGMFQFFNRDSHLGFRPGHKRRSFLGRCVRLHQALNSQTVVLFLVQLAVRLRAELAAAGESLQECQLRFAVETPHAHTSAPEANC
jgi:hypothetical protein